MSTGSTATLEPLSCTDFRRPFCPNGRHRRVVYNGIQQGWDGRPALALFTCRDCGATFAEVDMARPVHLADCVEVSDASYTGSPQDWIRQARLPALVGLGDAE